MKGSESRPPTDWNRLLIEGLVIVVSILSAFTIDAWWDQQREVRDARDQVARVVAELRANVEILEDQETYLGQATQAAREFLSMMGPDAAPVSTQVSRWINIRLTLTEILSEVQNAENNSIELRQMRPALLAHMQTFVSGLDRSYS